MKSLQRQQALYFLIIIVSLVLTLIIAASILKDLFFRQVKVDLEESSRILANMLPEGVLQRPDAMEGFCDQAGKSSGVRITIILADGVVGGDSQQQAYEMENHAGRPEFITAMRAGTGDSIRYSKTQKRWLMYFARRIRHSDGKPAGVVRVAVALDLLRGKLNSMYVRIMIVAFFALAISLVFSWFLVRSINGPIMRLISSARAFGREGVWPVTIIERPREIKLLAKTISKITDQLNRRMEETRLQSRQITAIFNSMVEALIVLDSNLDILELNPAAEELLKQSKADLRGMNLLDAFRNSELYNFAVETRDSTAAREMEVNLPADIVSESGTEAKSGPEISMQVNGTVIVDSETKNNRVLLVFNNISRIKQLERVRKDFVANVSHELKTPITSIKGFIETLLDGGLDDAENAKRFLQIAGRQTDHLIAILDDLLMLSSLEKRDMHAPVRDDENIRSIINNAIAVCRMKADEKNIRINNNVADRTMNLNGLMIEQAMINLIDNAVKYSENDSEINISLEVTEAGTGIEVADQGIGIPKEHQDRVFERFYRVDKSRSRESGGTGLGLAIVKHILKSHGGDVKVESIPGDGSRFFLIFPN